MRLFLSLNWINILQKKLSLWFQGATFFVPMPKICCKKPCIIEISWCDFFCPYAKLILQKRPCVIVISKCVLSLCRIFTVKKTLHHCDFKVRLFLYQFQKYTAKRPCIIEISRWDFFCPYAELILQKRPCIIVISRCDFFCPNAENILQKDLVSLRS